MLRGLVMFNVGDRIVYGNNGVCVVKDVIPSPFGKKDDDRLFYVLAPVYDSGNMVIYTPVDCSNVTVRESLMFELPGMYLEFLLK